MSRLRIGALVAAGAILVAACGGSTATPSPAASQAPVERRRRLREAPRQRGPSQPAADAQGGWHARRRHPGRHQPHRPVAHRRRNSSYVLQQAVEGLVTLKPGTGGEIDPVPGRRAGASATTA